MKTKSIVHRDIKPPNIILFDNGKIAKIADFGTGKLIQNISEGTLKE
jgi:serine/threonine protein kinase